MSCWHAGAEHAFPGTDNNICYLMRPHALAHNTVWCCCFGERWLPTCLANVHAILLPLIVSRVIVGGYVIIFLDGT